MVNYNKFQLDNGLRVIVHEDHNTPLVAVNLLYDVGARDESPHKTGFAHLFEHLMFEGSANVQNFDNALYRAGGESNAFTGNDITNYYDLIPANNLETVFWLESDRMLSLNFDEKLLQVQKDVVCEEFKESCLNQPYGDAWHHLRALSYEKHPYQWPVIGKELRHIEEIRLKEVEAFYQKHYRPNRAILAVAGGISVDSVQKMVNKWFGDIPSGPSYQRQLPKEPVQSAFRSRELEAKVPLDAIYMSFHSCDRYHPNYYVTDLINEMLSGGESGRLDALVREKSLFASLSSSLTGSFDDGLLMIYGNVAKGVSLQQAENEIWKVLFTLKDELIENKELEKIKNKVASGIAFSEIGIGSKAFNLAYFELMGNIDEINTEMERYLHIDNQQVRTVSQDIFRKENCCEVYYKTTEK